jgi:hypothetical protein
METGEIQNGWRVLMAEMEERRKERLEEERLQESSSGDPDHPPEEESSPSPVPVERHASSV